MHEGSRQGERTGVGLGACVFLVAILVPAILPGCARREQEQVPGAVALAYVDSVLAELGGAPTASLERGQRWRMISSIGSGLPPSLFKPEELPEPRSRGAGLVRVYCTQCHWIPAPQMHAASEWPILVRRMLMRARTLKDRLGGPLTEGLVGEYLMAGMTTAALPSAAELDTLLTYLQKHALPVARPSELTDGPGASLFLEKCSICHETPSPKAHTAAGWEGVVSRMKANMSMMGISPLTDREVDGIVAYLRPRASRGR